MIIIVCAMAIESCPHTITQGTRCCKVCDLYDCCSNGYKCLNSRDKCGILMELDTKDLDGKYRRNWWLYK